jgi:hypothetical protein
MELVTSIFSFLRFENEWLKLVTINGLIAYLQKQQTTITTIKIIVTNRTEFFRTILILPFLYEIK